MSRLLPLLLVAFAQDPAGRGGAAVHPPKRAPYDLTTYLAVAAAYGSGSRAAAVGAIREWRPREVNAALNRLWPQAKNLRTSATAPDHIAFSTVESAVLMHLEAGLLALQELRPSEADAHLRTSTTLFEWSRGAGAEARNWDEMRRYAFTKRFGREALPSAEIRERFDRRDYYLALAATVLAKGFSPKALPFAEQARLAAPVDPEVQLLFGCAAAIQAHWWVPRERVAEVTRLRDEAERALRAAVALDPEADEARLHLGWLLLTRGRLGEVEALLAQVERRAGDDRRRYLARLFLARLAEQRARPDEAADFYRRALEAWPDSQAAQLGLAHALEFAAGPTAALPRVAASLAASPGRESTPDPWWLFPFGPPGVARAALDRLWKKGGIER
jgi:tetratricopeptide (TPR) repeat protein